MAVIGKGAVRCDVVVAQLWRKVGAGVGDSLIRPRTGPRDSLLAAGLFACDDSCDDVFWGVGDGRCSGLQVVVAAGVAVVWLVRCGHGVGDGGGNGCCVWGGDVAALP